MAAIFLSPDKMILKSVHLLYKQSPFVDFIVDPPNPTGKENRVAKQINNIMLWMFIYLFFVLHAHSLSLNWFELYIFFLTFEVININVH